MFLSKESEQSFGASYCRAVKEGEAGNRVKGEQLQQQSQRGRRPSGPGT